MKFIPLDSFEAINSLITDVEAQGCLITVLLEAFTCRNTREEKQVAATIAYRVSNTPPISPQPHLSNFSVEMLPPPLLLSSSVPAASSSGVTNSVLGGNSPELQPEAISADDVDERLVYLVAALNNIYEQEDYDFTVLTEQDFIYETEEAVRNEVNRTLTSLPEICGPAVATFWSAVCEQVLDASQGCEFFRFHSRNCDPLADRTVFSTHYFLYNKRRKVVVSLRLFGTGNQYRGDDGCTPHGWEESGQMYYYDNDETSTRHDASSPEPMMDDVPADPYSMQKNRHFYGF